MKRVVIVGGGFGGLSIARKLASYARRGDVEVLVLDEKSSHTYTPWLYEVATEGVLGQETEKPAHARSASIPFSLFSGVQNIRYIQGKVQQIAQDGTYVQLQDGRTFVADAIVGAVGSRAHDFGIPGVHTFGNFLKTMEDAEHISRELHRIFFEIRTRRQQSATIVVVGAGPNGIELIAEIAAVKKLFCETFEIPCSRLQLVLCDAASEPGGMLHAGVRKRIQRRLKNLNVAFIGNTNVQEVRSGEIHAENVTIPFDLLLWSGGVRSRSEPGEAWGLPVNERGRVRVEDTFMVEGRRGIFVLGDAAVREGHHDPQSAQAATEQARIVAKNIIAFFSGRPLHAMQHRTWQTVLAVGGSYGVARVFGVMLTGRLAFFLRRFIDLKYFLSILPIFSACMLWYRGVEEYGKNDHPQA